jgi:Amt family ammonium transporter
LLSSTEEWFELKSVLNMMMMLICNNWNRKHPLVIFGYNWAFGSSANSPWIGGWGLSGLGNAVNSLANNGGVYPIPTLVFSSFQLMFAIITPALIPGAIADRTEILCLGNFCYRLGLYCLFPSRSLGI